MIAAVDDLVDVAQRDVLRRHARRRSGARICSSAPVPFSQWVWIGTPVRRWASAAAAKIGRSRADGPPSLPATLTMPARMRRPADDRARRSRARRCPPRCRRRTGRPARPRSRAGSSATGRRTARGGARSARRCGRRSGATARRAWSGCGRSRPASRRSPLAGRPRRPRATSSAIRSTSASRKSGRHLDGPAAVDDEMLVGVGHARASAASMSPRTVRTNVMPTPGCATTRRDQPPSTLRSWPVTARDSSDEEEDGGVGDLVGIHQLAARAAACARAYARTVAGSPAARGRHRRRGQAGRDDVDPDPVREVRRGHRRHQRGRSRPSRPRRRGSRRTPARDPSAVTLPISRIEPRVPDSFGSWPRIRATTARQTSAWVAQVQLERRGPSASARRRVWIGPSPNRRPLPPATENRPSIRPKPSTHAVDRGFDRRLVGQVGGRGQSAVPPAAAIRSASVAA